MKTINLILAVSLLSVLTTACGNMVNKGKQVNSTSNYQGSSLSYGNAYASAAEQCSPNPNIVAPTFHNSLESQYHGCTAPGTATGLKVYPADDAQKNICVFPARVTGNSIQTFVVNPYAPPATRFAFQCVTTSASGAVLSFNGLTYNAAYIVSSGDAAVFAACMAYGDISSCASQASIVYSFGQFR